MRPDEVTREQVALAMKARDDWQMATTEDDQTWWAELRVMLAAVLTAHDEMACNTWADLLDVEADELPDGWTRARGIADGLRRAARLLRGEEPGEPSPALAAVDVVDIHEFRRLAEGGETR